MGIKQELEQLRRDFDQFKRGSHVAGTVVSSSSVDKTVTMQIVHADGSSENVVFPVATNFIPEAGAHAVVTMNGTAPLVLPLDGHSVAAEGSWYRSADYVAGVSGWKIDADGSAEFNDVVVRGTLEAGVIRAGIIGQSLQSLSTAEGDDVFNLYTAIPNGHFDVNTTGWVVFSNCTMTRITSAPTPQAGAGCLRVTATGVGGMAIATTPLNVNPMQQFKWDAWFRSAVTPRNPYLRMLYYDGLGNPVNGNGWGTLPYGSGQVDDLIVTNTAGWTHMTVYSTAPPTAATMQLLVRWPVTALNEQQYVDSITNVAQSRYGFCPIADPQGMSSHNEGINAPSTTYAHTGTKSIRCLGVNDGVDIGYPNVGFDAHGVIANQAYSIGAWVRTALNEYGVRLFIAWFNNVGLYLNWPASPARSQTLFYINPTWSFLTQSFIAPAGAVAACYGVTMEPGGFSGAAGEMFVDDATLTPTTEMIDGILAPTVAASSQAVPPTGSIMPYLGQINQLGQFGTLVEPVPGWLAGFGQAVSRTIYKRLFAIFGIQFGAGDGSTTFNLPDLRGRTMFGVDNMGAVDAGRLSVPNTLGGVGGEETHLLTAAEMPTHTHPLGTTATNVAFGGVALDNAGGVGVAATGFAGGNGAHNNMPPYMLVNWLIKT